MVPFGERAFICENFRCGGNSRTAPHAAERSGSEDACGAGLKGLESSARSSDVVAQPDGSQLHLMRRRCGCFWCSSCAPKRTSDLRQKLLSAAERGAFCGRLQMLTLTIDRKRWRSPEECLRAVREGQYIVRFLRKLQRLGRIGAAYFWVMEFHQDGWPHWHLLVDIPEGQECFPGCWVQHGRKVYQENFWEVKTKLLTPSWGLGIVNPSVADMFHSSEHALFYVTKYIAKTGSGSVPAWALSFDGNITRYGCPKGFLRPPEASESLSGEGEAEPVEMPEPEVEPVVPEGYGKVPASRPQTIGERIGRCGASAVIMNARPRWEGGVVWEFVAEVERPHAECLGQLGVALAEVWSEHEWSRPISLDQFYLLTGRSRYANMINAAEPEFAEQYGREARGRRFEQAAENGDQDREGQTGYSRASPE